MKRELQAMPEKLERELTLTRTLAAPRELVFKAWTDPEHLARWWGPAGFTNPVCQVDLRPGGALYIVMRGPDGNDYPMKATFTEVVPPERLVFSSAAVDAAGNSQLEGVTSISFADFGGKTRLTVHTRMKGLVPEAKFMLAGMEPGWNQSLDRLTAEVERR